MEEPNPKGRQGFVYSGDRPTSLFNHLALIDLSVLLGSKFKKPHFPKLEVLIRSKEVFAHIPLTASAAGYDPLYFAIGLPQAQCVSDFKSQLSINIFD